MAESFREPFSNPYADESSNEARFSTVVVMDEAQERWKKGKWRPIKENFELDDSFFEDGAEKAPKDRQGGETLPDGASEGKKKNRFEFDLKRDVIDADVDASQLDDTSYSASYRPQGSIGSGISSLTVKRLRYNALAGIKEDVHGILAGEQDRDRSSKRKRESRIHRRDRLQTPVDERRAELNKSLPERGVESPESIMKDIRRRRDIEDAKSGVVRQADAKRRGKGMYSYYYEPGSIGEFYDKFDSGEVERLDDSGSWRAGLPQQDGLVQDRRRIPHFSRFSRRWSEVDSTEPARRDILRYTVNTIYDDEPTEGDESGEVFDENAHYVSDKDFDPYDRYRRLDNRRRLLRAEDGQLERRAETGIENPYVDMSDDRLKAILNHELRGPGHLQPPEGLTDQALLYEWNMGYSRANANPTDYSNWLDSQSELAENSAQSRYRAKHRTGRPGAYLRRDRDYGEARRYPHGEQRPESNRRAEMSEQLRQATERGVADGREIIRQQQAEEEKRRKQLYEQQQEYYRKQREQQLKYQKQVIKQQQEQLKQRQEMLKRQQEELMRRRGGANPSANPDAARAGSNAARVGANAAQGAAPAAKGAPTAQNRVPQPQYGAWGYYSAPPQPTSASPTQQQKAANAATQSNGRSGRGAAKKRRG